MADVAGVLNNKWPCCKRATQWHDITTHEDGEVIERVCKKDGRRWEITFSLTNPLKGMKPLLKLNWKEIGGRK